MIDSFVYIFIFLFLIFLHKFQYKLPYLPKDNPNKIQSTNEIKNTLLLNLLIFLPILFRYFEIIFIVPLLVVFVIGLLDDFYNLSVIKRFFLVGIVVTFLFIINDGFYLSKFIIYNIYINLNFYLGLILSLFLILGFIHVMNMSDGRNGLVVSYFLLITIYLSLKNEFNFFHIEIIISLVLILYLNIKNISYLGNNGLLVLSIFFGTLMFKYYNEDMIYIREVFILFFIPFYDGIYVTIKRLTLRKKLFEPDKSHLHHLVPNSKWNYSLLLILTIKILPLVFLYLFPFLNFIYFFMYSLLGYIFLRLLFNKIR